jgi:hypothetical protein
MGFLRGAGRWLLSLLVAAMVTAWIGASVMQATLLNRQVVKSWLASSGMYDKALRSLFNLESNQDVATKEDMQNAFDTTFPPNYIKQQTETVLDATYDWIDGKKPNISFSIPIKDKRDEFTANLIKQVQPRIAALPQCPSHSSPNTTKPTCIPQGTKADDFTKQLLNISSDDSFLAQPITPQSLVQSGQQVPNIPALPMYASYIRTLTLALPAGILLCAAAYVLLTDSKLKGLAIISRRTFFHALLIAVAGGLLWWFGSSLDLGAASQGADLQQILVIKNILNPVLRDVLPDVGRTIILYSGIVAAAGGIGWLASFIARRQLVRVTQFSPKPISTPAPAPITPTPKALPQPTPVQKKPPTQPPRVML